MAETSGGLFSVQQLQVNNGHHKRNIQHFCETFKGFDGWQFNVLMIYVLMVILRDERSTLQPNLWGNGCVYIYTLMKVTNWQFLDNNLCSDVILGQGISWWTLCRPNLCQLRSFSQSFRHSKNSLWKTFFSQTFRWQCAKYFLDFCEEIVDIFN